MQPFGQPTDGISVAAVCFGSLLSGTPSARLPNADEIRGCLTGCVLVLAEELAEPAHALTAHEVVGVEPVGRRRVVRHVPADDDRRVRLVLPDQAAHLRGLARGSG